MYRQNSMNSGNASEMRILETSTQSLNLGGEKQEGNWSFVAFAWRRKWLVAVLVIVGLGLGYLHFNRQEPVYRSSAQLLIVENKPRLPIAGLDIVGGYNSTHEKLLRSPAIVGVAVNTHNLAGLESLKNTPNPVSEIIKNLSVSGEDSTYGDIVIFRYECGNNDDCATILTAMISAYRKYLGEKEESVGLETVALIREAKEQLDTEIAAASDAYQKFRAQGNLLFSGESAQNIHENRLTTIEGVRSTALLENSKIKAQIEAIRAALERGADREALYLAIGYARKSEELETRTFVVDPTSATEEHLFPMMLEEKMLLEKYGPDHPKVVELRKRIEFTREHLLDRADQLEEDTQLEKPPKDYIEVFISSLLEQAKMNLQTISELDDLFQKERDAAKLLSDEQITDAKLKSAITRKQQMFDVVISRLEEISLVSDASKTTIQELYSPSIGSQIAPDLKQIMVTAGLLGTLAGLGLAYVVDSADRRFRNPREIRNDFRLPVIGHIPVIPRSKTMIQQVANDSKFATLDISLRTVHQPRGRIAEAYRLVRTALYFSSTDKESQVIQVTSPSPGDGKSTLAANIAVSIANSGKSVLLVDADFRRPRVDRLFGVENALGINNVLEGHAELADVTQSSGISNLFLLSAGPRPENPSEILTSNQFQELLDVLREQYDFVIVDTPPILAVTDPMVVAPRVDGVILVLRLAKNTRSLGHRAIEALDAVGANILGVVVNGVSNSPSYGAGRYDYTSNESYGSGGYGYGYDYTYDYEYTENDASKSESKIKVDVGVDGATETPKTTRPN
ncbi:MAG: polysaccharide biosynthesis tyrosine autokinase [Pirellulaceae bacterium]|nr:polysaccharide biosynthesis tyrosine autokinase [Pirellulaceae bacterium]